MRLSSKLDFDSLSELRLLPACPNLPKPNRTLAPTAIRTTKTEQRVCPIRKRFGTQNPGKTDQNPSPDRKRFGTQDPTKTEQRLGPNRMRFGTLDSTKPKLGYVPPLD